MPQVCPGDRRRGGRGCVVIRLDQFAPSWVRGIVDDLEAGSTGREAVAGAVRALTDQATRTADAAAGEEAQAAAWERMQGVMICADTMLREHADRAQEHRRYESYLRNLVVEVGKLRGEVMMGWLR